MCINLGNIPGMLLSPISLIKSATGIKNVGILDYMDPTSILAKKQDKKLEKQAAKEEKASQEAWNRYYASLNSGGTSSSPFQSYSGGNK